jgi:FkbM family methyltransferase
MYNKMEDIKIYYGILNNKIDVTNICFTTLNRNNIITIPCNDLNRAYYFGDTLSGILKSIFISYNDKIEQYEDIYTIKINLTENTINVVNKYDIDFKTLNIHSKLKINYGSFNEELPEQKMVVRYLSGKEKVLEIGGNIGRNSLVIASILQDQKNLVTLESDMDIAKQLQENRDNNNYSFYIENSALSNKKMIQREWDTKVSDVLINGWKWVNTITFTELKNKYNIEFDTLVLDCEGAFYYILQDMPEILNGINLIIMENDYWDINHKLEINRVLLENNFYVDYIESGGWGPCYNNFYEVWKK